MADVRHEPTASGTVSIGESLSVRPTRVRWAILAMLFVVTTINYADRATIAIAGPEIRRALGLSPVQLGYVFSAFARA